MKRARSNGWRKLLLLATVFAMVVAACTGDETTDTTTGETTETTADTSTETTEGGTDTTAPSGDDDEELVLQATMSEEATDLHPLTTGQQGKGHIYQAIFHPILETDNENQIFSNVLESWEMSDDAVTATLVLSEGQEWSDGEPITAEDLHLTFTLFLDNNISNHASRIGGVGVVGQEEYVAGEADSIEGLTVVDERTLTVELLTPDAAWLPNLAALADDVSVLPAHILGDVPADEILDHEYFRTYPVSNGPYLLEDFVEGQHAELVRNDNWSHGTAGFDRVFLRIVSTDVQAAQLETGEIQVMFPVDPADVDRISGIEGISVGSAQGVAPELWSIMFDDDELDPRVRQAMLFAIDRAGICEQAMSGYCSVPTTNIRQIALGHPDGGRVPGSDRVRLRPRSSERASR